MHSIIISLFTHFSLCSPASRRSPCWPGEHWLSSSSMSSAAHLRAATKCWCRRPGPGPDPAATTRLHATAGRLATGYEQMFSLNLYYPYKWIVHVFCLSDGLCCDEVLPELQPWQIIQVTPSLIFFVDLCFPWCNQAHSLLKYISWSRFTLTPHTEWEKYLPKHSKESHTKKCIRHPGNFR